MWHFENWRDVKHEPRKLWSVESVFSIFAKLFPCMISGSELHCTDAHSPIFPEWGGGAGEVVVYTRAIQMVGFPWSLGTELKNYFPWDLKFFRAWIAIGQLHFWCKAVFTSYSFDTRVKSTANRLLTLLSWLQMYTCNLKTDFIYNNLWGWPLSMRAPFTQAQMSH